MKPQVWSHHVPSGTMSPEIPFFYKQMKQGCQNCILRSCPYSSCNHCWNFSSSVLSAGSSLSCLCWRSPGFPCWCSSPGSTLLVPHLRCRGWPWGIHLLKARGPCVCHFPSYPLGRWWWAGPEEIWRCVRLSRLQAPVENSKKSTGAMGLLVIR